MKLNKTLSLLFLFFIFSGCAINQQSIKSIAQSNSASQIQEYVDVVLKDLILYKEKLDLRNPKGFNKNISKEIIAQIKNKQNYINLIQDGKKLTNYNEYLYYAFDSKDINNRNDFLILGIYKLMHNAFSLNKKHQFVAMQYSSFEMLKLYEYLQVLRWKIKTSKDEYGNFLFNTWQNNWQLQLLKKDLNDLNVIKDLAYIKDGKESLFDSSNFSFEILISLMLSNVEHILKKIDVEPYEMGFNAIKSFVFIL